jgi:SpoVK/Ycf46/Vps4 family AAA+-type ATPase
MFFVDLPDALERAQIWDIVIARHGRKARDFDTVALARACEQFTGAEIETDCPSSMCAGLLSFETSVAAKCLHLVPTPALIH